MLPNLYLGTCLIVCIAALAAALEDVRFEDVWPPGEEQEQTEANDMAGIQSCIGQLDVTRLLTKLTALEEVVAEIKEDTKFSQAGAAVAAVSLVLALLYVAVVCGVAARNLGNARQQKLKREEQERLDEAANKAARRLHKRSGSKDKTREPLL